MPGGTRQSTSSSALAGITLIFSDAKIRVGTAVTHRVGSTQLREPRLHGADVRDRGRGIVGILAERGEQRTASSTTSKCFGRSPSRVMHGRELEQGVVAGTRHRRVAGDARGRGLESGTCPSPRRQTP